MVSRSQFLSLKNTDFIVEQSLLQRIRAIESGEEKQVKDVKEALLKTLRAQRVMIAKQLNTPPLIALATSEWGGALVNQEAVNMPDFDILSNEDRDEISRGTVPDVEDLRGAVDVLWNFSHDLLRSKAWLMKRMNSTEAGTGSAVLSQTALGKSTFASISTANSFTVAEFDDLLQRLRTYSNLQQLRTYSKAAYPKSYAKVLSSLQKCLEERRPALRHILVRIEENPHYMFYQTLLQLYRVLLGLGESCDDFPEGRKLISRFWQLLLSLYLIMAQSPTRHPAMQNRRGPNVGQARRSRTNPSLRGRKVRKLL